MKIDVIYSFDTKPQQRATHPFVIPILVDKGTFIDFLVSVLSREERGEIIKISTCLITPLAYPITNNHHKEKKHWFNICKGKIWVDDLELWRHDRGIKSTVSKTFLKEFADANPTQ